ncbi:MAG TPA: YihY/virulence factor BrkB family protein [Burkholderiales bacterium]|nr:YihY/virulence factor BrkB family protein [Burkholderiales bacterium]
MRPRQLIPLAKEALASWSNDRAPSMGAAISYYSVFSLAPLLVIIITVAGFFFGADQVQGAIFGQLASLMGDSAAQAVDEMLKHAQEPKVGSIAGIVSLLVLIVGATTVLAELQAALDKVWKVPASEKPQGNAIWLWIRTRILTFSLVLAMAFLMIISLVFSAALSTLGKWWGGLIGGWEGVVHVLDLGVSFAMLTVAFAVIYKLMPSTPIRWKDVWVGAAVTSLLFTIGKWAIGLYLGKSDVASAFGLFGSLALMMIWIYYSAQIFLLGAEFTWVYANHFGSRRAVTEKPVQTSKPEVQKAPQRELRIDTPPVSRKKNYARAAASGGAFAAGILLARLIQRRGGAG